MSMGSLRDRRRVAQSQLEELAERPGQEHPEPLRRIVAEVLGFETVRDGFIAVGPDAGLGPAGVATVIGRLADEFGPDYLAVHFDLSSPSDGRRRDYVTLAQVQAANDLAQRYAGEVRCPLLVFTLPDGSGVQFVTGDPQPSNRYRLQDILRVTAYHRTAYRTALDCLESAGSAIAAGGIPRRAFREAFNVQPITEAFFKDYKAAYDSAVAQIGGAIDRADAEKFTQTLFNRLLFVHFVSKKGWLKFRGNSDYLNALWRDYQANPDRTNFYRSRLNPLFFAGLNNPQSINLTRDNPAMYALIGDVHFLNGGLFEKTELEMELDRRAGDLVPDAAVAPLLDGEAGLFNRYNFTVTEATPLDTEVAVDPEMLGKLFEETVNERHSNGAYYTPRPVVAFMCQEAIKGYLGGQDIDGLDDAKIAALIDRQETDGVTPQQALEIANAVAAMKAVDPACGSGAFLLGMLQEIIAVNATLINAGHTPDSLYRQKLDIITNNIYGADLDKLAVSTAMLRLWLSLAVDYDGDGPPDPLPNLDLKLVDGDAIAGPNPQLLDFTWQGIVNSGLRQDIAAYTTAHGQQKVTLKKRVKATKEKLRAVMQDAAPPGVVEWRIDFADVMLNGGFDVVIANPPYVQLQGDGGRLANLYRPAGYETFVRSGDIYQLFYERGGQLLRPGRGLLAYITSNSWLKAEYGKTTRRWFAENHTPLRLLEPGKDVFAASIVDSAVLVARHGISGERGRAVDMDRLADKTLPPAEEHWGELRTEGERPWSALSAVERSAMDKMEAVGTPLRDWDVAINYGIKTGLNAAFIIDGAKRQELIAADPKSAEIIKPILRGRDIRRYKANWADWWLIDTHNGYGDVSAVNVNDYPAVKVHLDGLYPNLEKRQDKGRTPYNLRSCAYYPEFAKEKLVWMDLTEQGRFAYNADGMFCLDTTFTMSGQSIKYLCAVLNSTLITWYMANTALNSGMGVTRWKRFTVERIPVPKISAAGQRPFIRLVEEILEAKGADGKADTTVLEREIDRVVYDLYGLTGEEETAIERSLRLIHPTDEGEDAALLQLALAAEGELGREGYVGEGRVLETLRATSENSDGD